VVVVAWVVNLAVWVVEAALSATRSVMVLLVVLQ